MYYNDLHKWKLSPKEAIRLQHTLRDKLLLNKVDQKGLKYIAGVDVSVKNNLSKATIGSAKNHLFGSHETPGPNSLLFDKEDNPIGAVLRTRDT